MRVLVVDDSVVFRSQIKGALEGIEGVEVVGSANNGKIAIQKLQQVPVDLITLDLEMPEMGGLETIKEIKRLKFPLKIIVFSSHSTRGSEMTLEALRLGAEDFVAKPQGDDLTFANAQEKIREELLPKIMQFAGVKVLRQNSPINITPLKSNFSKLDLHTFRPQVILIGSSTGGPPALEIVLKNLPKDYRLPILIAQHMPPIFTVSLARRLKETSGLESQEAIDNSELKPGHIYVAPGDFHLVLKK
jgi:two-component system chemotaxis response regulator CheB